MKILRGRGEKRSGEGGILLWWGDILCGRGEKRSGEGGILLWWGKIACSRGVKYKGCRWNVTRGYWCCRPARYCVPNKIMHMSSKFDYDLIGISHSQPISSWMIHSRSYDLWFLLLLSPLRFTSSSARTAYGRLATCCESHSIQYWTSLLKILILCSCYSTRIVSKFIDADWSPFFPTPTVRDCARPGISMLSSY